MKLAIQHLDQLPQPPTIVDDHIQHWLQWLRFLPSAGPRKQTMCSSIEREYYLQITRKLQSQYHPAEPDERQMYDWRMGERFENALNAISETRRKLVRLIHYHHQPIPKVMRETGLRKEDRFHMELLGTYQQLAGCLSAKGK